MSPKLHRRLFSVWSGVAFPPLYVGFLWITFAAHWAVGVGCLLLVGLWLYDMGETTCSRCASYGTLNCGVQGKWVSWFWKRRDPRTVSRFRVRLHFAADLGMMALLCGAYLWWDWRWAVGPLAWTGAGVYLVFGPGRHHGLLHLLKQPEAKARTVVASLPVLSSSSELAPPCANR